MLATSPQVMAPLSPTNSSQFVTIIPTSGRGGRRSLGDRLGGQDGDGRREDEEDDVVNKSVMSRVVKVTRVLPGQLIML